MTPTRSTSKRPAALWLLAALPFIPLVLVFWSYALPKEAEGLVLPLVGSWRGHAASEGFSPFEAGSEGWTPLRLPGSFKRQGLPPEHLWLERQFDVPPALVGQDAVFVIGNVRVATLRLFFNGQPIGHKGLGRRFLGIEAGAESFFVPGTLVKPTDNRLTIEVTGLEKNRDGITDPRLLFGRHDVLGPWAFQEHAVRTLLEQGSLLLIGFLALLLVALWVLQGARTNFDLYRGSFVLLSSAAVYLVGKSGVVAAGFLDGPAQVRLLIAAVHLVGLGVIEFTEAYFLGRATIFRQVNRVVSAAAIVLSQAQPGATYGWYAPWLLLLIVYSLVLAIRDFGRRDTVFGPLVGVATLLVGTAGISDLLGDFELVYAPRLFTYAIANMAAMCAAVVVAEFLDMARENQRLSASLFTRNEELAVALKKAEEGSRIKSEFLANTSHELRTPLNAIINIPQGLLEQFHRANTARCETCEEVFELDEGETITKDSPCPACGKQTLVSRSQLELGLAPEEAARLLESIVRSGTHLLAVVNDILDYSKLEAGRLVLHREKVNARTLVEEVKLTMEPVATRAGVALSVDASAAEVELEADRVKLTQVLVNLVGNAIKFSDGKGTVTVKARAESSALVVSVKDEGIGIAPEHQHVIFEGFRQVEGSHTRRFGGSGLGLAISRRLVGMHGGTLTVQSALGQGSVFSIELPLGPAQVKDVERKSA